MPMMMPVGFAIGRDVHQLVPLSLIIKGAGQTLGELLAAGEQTFKGDGLRHRAVIEKNGDGLAALQLHEIRTSRIDLTAIDVLPVALANLTHAAGLEGLG